MCIGVLGIIQLQFTKLLQHQVNIKNILMQRTVFLCLADFFRSTRSSYVKGHSKTDSRRHLGTQFLHRPCNEQKRSRKHQLFYSVLQKFYCNRTEFWNSNSLFSRGPPEFYPRHKTFSSRDTLNSGGERLEQKTYKTPSNFYFPGEPLIMCKHNESQMWLVGTLLSFWWPRAGSRLQPGL